MCFNFRGFCYGSRLSCRCCEKGCFRCLLLVQDGWEQGCCKFWQGRYAPVVQALEYRCGQAGGCYSFRRLCSCFLLLACYTGAPLPGVAVAEVCCIYYARYLALLCAQGGKQDALQAAPVLAVAG